MSAPSQPKLPLLVVLRLTILWLLYKVEIRRAHLRGPGLAKVLRAYRRLRQTRMIDPSYYLGHFAGRSRPVDLLAHYLVVGEPRCISPHPLFNPAVYRQCYADFWAAGFSPLEHFEAYGRNEGRISTLVLDERVVAHPSGALFTTLLDQFARFDLLNEAVLDTASDDMIAQVRADLRDGLSADAAPKVSIIIPVHNKIRHTLSCVLSVMNSPSRHSAEMIVVDDASTDATRTALADLEPGIRVLRNETNQGFIRSCNRGAAAAKGQVLVFLNNDTFVLPGWLDALVETLAEAPKAGLVGSRLLYPDGHLQEAGGLIWQDGSIWNYGRLSHPGAPEMNYRRIVDYCSGASIALTAELWGQLGGFDEHYLPAYCEDADLALKVRQAGLNVYYQPMSSVIHFEGVSSGRDLTRGVKKYQVDNLRKLFERWQSMLASHRPSDEQPALEMERTVRRRVLVIDHRTPQPDHDAGSVVTMGMIEALQANGYKVTFLPENMAFNDRYTRDLQRRGVECIYGLVQNTPADYLKLYGGLFDVVLVYRYGVLWNLHDAIQQYCPKARLILHAADLHFLREERGASVTATTTAEPSRTKRRELAMIQVADCTIVHSSHEAELLATLLPEATVYCFPLIIDVKGSARPFADRADFAFVGGYEHTPNLDAARYFIADVLPLIVARLPDVVFKVVGSKMPDSLRAMAGPNIEMVGFVDDLASVLDTVRLTVAPLRFGAGVKGKVVSSMSYGVPCVGSTLAIEGMDLRPGEDVMVADTPEAIAEAVVRAYTDEALWNTLSANGLAFVARTTSYALAISRTADVLRLVGAPLPAEDTSGS